MSVNIFHKTGSGTGTLQKVAGNTVILDATTSETRAGTFNISRATSGTVSQNILFDNPMPDANYMVNFELTSGSGNDGPGLVITNKSTTGFTVTINTTGAADLSVEYNAFKLVELKDYTSMQNAILNADSSPTQNSENLIKSGGVFEALKGAGTVFTGTKSEWENLDPSEQERYEIACLTDDEEAVNSRIGYIGEEVETTIHEWNDSLQNGSVTEDVILTEDGWYFIQVLLENSAAKDNNTFTFSMLGKDNEYHTLIRHSYNQPGTMTVTHMIPLKAGSYHYSHTASSNAVDGRAYVYMNRRDMA